MKKILMALTIAAFGYFSAEAQTEGKKKIVACGAPEGKVCNKKSCYKTKYAENFAVCKGGFGYYICCEEPNTTNSTFSPIPYAALKPYRTNDAAYAYQETTTADGIKVDMAVPQSQSYPVYSANVATSYEGYYNTRKNHMKVCSNSDNVADENRAPYNGCPSPAYDGPDRNTERNKNVSNPNSSFPTPPNSGNRK